MIFQGIPEIKSQVFPFVDIPDTEIFG